MSLKHYSSVLCDLDWLIDFPPWMSSPVGNGMQDRPNTIQCNQLVGIFDGGLHYEITVNIRSARGVAHVPNPVQIRQDLQRILNKQAGEIGNEQVEIHVERSVQVGVFQEDEQEETVAQSAENEREQRHNRRQIPNGDQGRFLRPVNPRLTGAVGRQEVSHVLPVHFSTFFSEKNTGMKQWIFCFRFSARRNTKHDVE